MTGGDGYCEAPWTRRSAAFFAVFLALGAAHAQKPDAKYAEGVRKAESLGVAVAFLDLENTRLLFDAARKSGFRTSFNYGNEVITQANADKFARYLDRSRQVLSDEMNRRGSTDVAGDYDIQKDARNECRLAPEPLGPVTVTQNGSAVEFNDAGGRLSGKGVIVASSLATKPVTLFSGSLYLVGEVTKEGLEIGFLDLRQLSRCRIGVLTRRG